MQKECQYLTDWIRTYLEHKDMFYRKIKKIENNDNSLHVISKDSEKTYLCDISLDNINLNNLTNSDAIVTLNTKENINYLISNWSDFIKCTKLAIYFVNPFSTQDHRWIIYPYTHHQITERSVLKSGIRSMASSVDIIAPREFSSKI